MFAAYAETAPLAEGWEQRVELWQLLPLLVHAVLFGGSYGAAAERQRRYALALSFTRRRLSASRPRGRVGVEECARRTLSERHRLYLTARVLVKRHYRRELTLAAVARALACSPRQLQRAYAQFGGTTFQEDLRARRMAAAAELLAEQSDPGGGRRAAGGLQPRLALRARVPPPLRALPGALPGTRAGSGMMSGE